VQPTDPRQVGFCVRSEHGTMEGTQWSPTTASRAGRHEVSGVSTDDYPAARASVLLAALASALLAGGASLTGF